MGRIIHWVGRFEDILVLITTLIIDTWIFFGPVGGFHHILILGVLRPFVLQAEETPRNNALMWGDHEVIFSPARFAISFVLWLVVLFVVMRWWRTTGLNGPRASRRL